MGRKPVRADAPYDRVVVEAVVASGRLRGRIGDPDSWEIVRRLAALEFSDGQIAYRIGRTRRTVQRVRAALGIPAPCKGLGSPLYLPVQGEPTVRDT